MPSPLRWAYATKADVPDIQSFTCSRKVRKTPPFGSWRHPEPWTHKAQSLARDCVPCREPDYLLLGRQPESGNLKALVRWVETSNREGATIKVIAVALDAQACGYGREAMNEALGELAQHAEPYGQEAITVLCEVHPLNSGSLALLTRTGFEFHRINKDHQVWALDYLLAGATGRISRP